MSLGSFIKKQFIDILQWNEDSDGVLSYRFPMQDFEIQYGGSLTVRESQVAVFVNEGKIADVFGLLRRFAIRGPAGVQDQQRHASFVEEAAKLGGIHRLRIAFEIGVFEVYFAGEAVAVKMNHVERLALRLGLAQPLGELLEGGRP